LRGLACFNKNYNNLLAKGARSKTKSRSKKAKSAKATKATKVAKVAKAGFYKIYKKQVILQKAKSRLCITYILT
jgi:hypothetical protein